MIGTWVVEEFKLNGKELVFNGLEVNMCTFENNQRCVLPMRDIPDKDASWKIVKKGRDYVLLITGAKDNIFNQDFKIEFSNEKRGLGTAKIVKLTSSSLYWKSTQ